MFVELFFFKVVSKSSFSQFLYFIFIFTSKIINKYRFNFKILKAKLKEKKLIKGNYILNII
jgi:hypothetical protein